MHVGCIECVDLFLAINTRLAPLPPRACEASCISPTVFGAVWHSGRKFRHKTLQHTHARTHKNAQVWCVCDATVAMVASSAERLLANASNANCVTESLSNLHQHCHLCGVRSFFMCCFADLQKYLHHHIVRGASTEKCISLLIRSRLSVAARRLLRRKI